MGFHEDTCHTGADGGARQQRYELPLTVGTGALAAWQLHRVAGIKYHRTACIPVLPSEIDIHAVSRCIADLLLVGRMERYTERVAVIANRVKKNTLIYAKLQRFLHSLGIPFVTSLRDTQNYVRASAAGMGIHELDARAARDDVRDWQALIDWLEQRPAAERAPSSAAPPPPQPAG